MDFWILRANEPVPNLDDGDRPQRACLLARELAKRGHRVTWWVSTFDHFRKRQRFTANRSIDAGGDFTIRLLFSAGYRRNVSLARYLDHLAVARNFARNSVSLPTPDLIFAALPTLELSAAGATFARATMRPFVSDIRDLWPDELIQRFPRILRGPGRLAITPMRRDRDRVVRTATALTATSQTLLNWGLHHAGRHQGILDRVFVHGYPALDSDPCSIGELKTKGIDFTKKLLVYVGTFNASADLHTVVAAAGELHRSGIDSFQFVLAGAGERKGSLQALAAQLPNVIFPGWLTHNQLVSLLDNAFLGLSVYNSGVLISLPNKIFEYMSAGLPVLNSLEGECATLVDGLAIGRNYHPENSRDFLHHLFSLMRSESTYRAMAENANKQFSSRFSAQHVYSDMVSYLESIAEQHQFMRIKNSLSSPKANNLRNPERAFG